MGRRGSLFSFGPVTFPTTIFGSKTSDVNTLVWCKSTESRKLVVRRLKSQTQLFTVGCKSYYNVILLKKAVERNIKPT